MKRIKAKRLFLIVACLGILGIYLCGGGQAYSGSYQQVTVQPGDTLWNIAAKVTPESTDIRSTIYHIQKINGLKSSAIRPGQILKVPQ